MTDEPYYTKEEIDDALATKANIVALTNFYDRMTVDNLLADKVDKADLTARINTYSGMQDALNDSSIREIQVDANIAIEITTPLTINRAVKISGGCFTCSAGAAFSIAASDVELDGLTINGSGNATRDSAQKLIYAQGTSTTPLNRVAIRNCKLKDSASDNIWMEWCVDSIASNNIITDYLYSGIMVVSGTRVMVSNNIIRNAALSPGVVNVYGIAITDLDNTIAARSKNCSVIGNHVSLIDWEGIDTHGGDGLNISGNTVIACPRGIALVSGNDTRLTSPTRCVVTGNLIDAAGSRSSVREGIFLSGISGVPANGTVTGNHITNHSPTFSSTFVDRAKFYVGNNNLPFVPWDDITLDGDFIASKWIPQYMVDGNTVYLRGAVIPKSTSSRTIIGHLDSPFARPDRLTFSGIIKGSGTSTAFAALSIDTDGTIKASYWSGTPDTFTYFLSGSYQAI